MALNQEHYYEIRVEGILPGSWSEWLEGMKICIDGNGTLLAGRIVDQAALLSLLLRLHNLNLTLISVTRL
jgi:hypothetical protein